MKLKGFVSKTWEFLLAPSTFFDFTWDSRKGHIILYMWSGFLMVWIAANLSWKFPRFSLFLIAFSTILVITFGTLKFFFNHMQDLNDDLAGYGVFQQARYFFQNSGRTYINILFPITFVLTFGIGGYMLYTKAQLTPTFALFMIYFVIMVYLSMIIYLQYVRFSWYLHLLAKDESPLTELIQPAIPDNGISVLWLQSITDITCRMRYMFASVGLSYIFAFALFCFTPAFGASVTAVIFYVLWILIAVFVVLVFCVTNYLNNKNLRLLRDRVKRTYVDALIVPEYNQNDVGNAELNKFVMLLRQACAAAILNSPDFPVREASNWMLSVGITAVQVVASLVTLYQFQISTPLISIPIFL